MAIEAVVSQLNSSALGKAVTNSQGAANAAQNKATNFADVMKQIDPGTDFAGELGMLNNDISSTGHMQTLNADGVEFTPTDKVTEVSSPEASEKIINMLGDVNNGQMQMDSLVNHILHSGKKFSNQELLVIQAHVFHFAQMTELTVKVAEQGVSSVKSVLNTQVQ
jgi:hypothetical protein